jgi:hypothetical protein
MVPLGHPSKGWRLTSSFSVPLAEKRDTGFRSNDGIFSEFIA